MPATRGDGGLGRGARRSIVGRAALLGLALALLGTRAWAQTASEVATRRMLLEQSEAARRAGRHEESLDLATRAGAITMTPSLRLFIAEEQVAVRQLAEALGTVDLCVRDVAHATTGANLPLVRRRCEALRRSLLGRVGRVVVVVPEPPPDDLRVTLSERPLNPSLYGVPVVVNPGPLTLAATAPGRVPWSATLTVAPRATEEVRVELPLAPPEPAPPPPEPSPAPPVSPPVTPPEVPPVAPPERSYGEPPLVSPPASLPLPTALPPPSRGQGIALGRGSRGGLQRTLGWVSGGLGLASLVGGVAANLWHNGVSGSAADRGCGVDPYGAVQGGSACADDARTMDTARTLAIVGYVGAGVFGVSALVLFFTAPRGTEPSGRSAVSCGPGGLPGVACVVRF